MTKATKNKGTMSSPKGKRIPVPEERLCTAHKNGTDQRCSVPAIKGGKVCVYHGGSAPQVREAAQRRLLEAVDPALAKLVRLALDNNEKNASVQLGAVKDILDRAGLGATAKVDLTVQEVTPDEVKTFLEGAYAQWQTQQETAK